MDACAGVREGRPWRWMLCPNVFVPKTHSGLEIIRHIQIIPTGGWAMVTEPRRQPGLTIRDPAGRGSALKTKQDSDFMRACRRARRASVPTGLRARGRDACGARCSLHQHRGRRINSMAAELAPAIRHSHPTRLGRSLVGKRKPRSWECPGHAACWPKSTGRAHPCSIWRLERGVIEC